MDAPQSTLTLQIRKVATSGDPTYLVHYLLDGAPILSNHAITADTDRAIHTIAADHADLLIHTSPPPGKSVQDHANNIANRLNELGTQLFDHLLSPVWDRIEHLPPGNTIIIVIASQSPVILNLPWEIARPPARDHLGFDPHVGIRRLPEEDGSLGAAAVHLPGYPLRVLFMACSPRDQDELDYDAEEERLYRALTRAGIDAVLDVADLGTFDELKDRLDEFKPHVVHLSGHGVVGADLLGLFAFEDERGNSDLRTSLEIRRLLAARGVQAVFVSACDAATAPARLATGGLCQGLVHADVPLAIGWTAPIVDDVATDFASALYRALATNQPIDRALVQAREAIRKRCQDRGDASWTLPVLYAATTQTHLFDPSRHEPPHRPTVKQDALPGMTEGHAESFVGRRREQQALIPALRDGSLHVLLLTGLGGIGKSTLATRLARRLEVHGFRPIPIPSKRGNELSVSRLIGECRRAFFRAGLRDAYQTLLDANMPVSDRLWYIVDVLNDHPYTLVLDNFEVNLDEQTHQFIGPASDLADFYIYLMTNLTGRSRAIITTRYPPAGTPVAPHIATRAVPDFPTSPFFKLLLRDEAIRRRIGATDDTHLPPALLHRLHGLLGGALRFINQLTALLRTIPAPDLGADLDRIEREGLSTADNLRQQLDTYFEFAITERLYNYLFAESRRALSRAAVFSIPVNSNALAAVSGESPERINTFVEKWQEFAFAYRDEMTETNLWSIYGVLRPWLRERLGADELNDARLAAGDFLMELAESDRADDIALSWEASLEEARSQFQTARDCKRFRTATHRLSRPFQLRGLHREVIRLNQDALACEEHSTPLNWIAQSYLNLANYPEARTWYIRSLAATDESDKDQVAFVRHELATLALREGDHAAARAGFGDALALRQAIGDRAGEAATFYQLGMLADEMERPDDGIQLVALCYLIDDAIGHGDANTVDWRNLTAMASRIGLDQAQFNTLLSEVAEAYNTDQGRGLIKAAFEPE